MPFRWFKSKRKPNQISQIETVELESPDGEFLIAIQIAVDIGDPGSSGEFLSEVAQAFLKQRMISPPETNGLLISVMGMQPDEFASLWADQVNSDKALRAFMDRMTVADAMGFMRNAPGQPASVSLIAT